MRRLCDKPDKGHASAAADIIKGWKWGTLGTLAHIDGYQQRLCTIPGWWNLDVKIQAWLTLESMGNSAIKRRVMSSGIFDQPSERGLMLQLWANLLKWAAPKQSEMTRQFEALIAECFSPFKIDKKSINKKIEKKYQIK